MCFLRLWWLSTKSKRHVTSRASGTFKQPILPILVYFSLKKKTQDLVNISLIHPNEIFHLVSLLFFPLSVRPACLRIVDVRGIMGRACAKQLGAHVQSNGLRMCKAMACTWQWLYLLANTSAPLKDQSLMLSLSCMDMVSPDKLSRLLLSMSTIRKHASRNSHGARDWDLSYG